MQEPDSFPEGRALFARSAQASRGPRRAFFARWGGEARKIKVTLAGARVSPTLSRPGFRIARLRADLLSGTPHPLRKQVGHGNGAAMQSMENDEAVSHPSHSRLEDADEARVSHIPTTTATRLDRKDKQRRLLHRSIGLFLSIENAGWIASENATSKDQSELFRFFPARFSSNARSLRLLAFIAGVPFRSACLIASSAKGKRLGS